MSERAHYQTLRAHLCRPGDRMDRVENALGAGMPDINWCAEGIEVWLELKSPTEPQRDRTPLFGSNHPLSIDQENWLLRQWQAGGRAFVVISTDQRWMVIAAHDVRLINVSTVGRLLSLSIWTARKPIRGDQLWRNLRHALLYRPIKRNPSHIKPAA